MPSGKEADMRKYIRHPSNIPIECTVVDDQASVSQSLQNISRGGLSFASRKPLKKGLLVTVNIPGRDFEARGRVVWCRKSAGSYDVGVSFINKMDAYTIRMVEQVCHIEQYRQQVRQFEGRELTGAEAATEWIERYAETFPHPEI